MPSVDLLVFGDTALDNFYEVNTLPDKNQASEVNSAKRFYGGMGANTAVVANNLGLSTGLVSVIGTDAEDYRNYMSGQGIRLFLKGIFGDTTKSMFFKNNGDQVSFFYKGVTEKLNDLDPFKEFKKNLPKDPKNIYLARTYLGLHKKVVKQYKKSFVVWNPGYGVFKMNELGRDFKAVLKETDVLVLNHHELRHLEKLGFKLTYRLGPKYFIQTLSDKGSIVCTKNSQVQFKTYKTKVADESGAGDAFNAGFIAGIKNGFDVFDSALIANCTSSFIVESWGCQINLPTWEQVMKRYHKLK